jgi:hypothetical protein
LHRVIDISFILNVVPFSLDAGVRAKLDRIMASDYYTAQATMDVAAAVGSYAGDEQAQEGMAASPVVPAVEEGVTVEGHKVK